MFLICVMLCILYENVTVLVSLCASYLCCYVSYVCSFCFSTACTSFCNIFLWQEMQSFNHRTDRRPRSSDVTNDVDSQPPEAKRIRGRNKPHKPRNGQIALIPEGDKYVTTIFFSLVWTMLLLELANPFFALIHFSD